MIRRRVSGWVTGWRVPLRIARRDARRSRGRTALALVLLALPVLAVTVADTLYATNEISGTEALERRLGAADVRVDLGSGQAYQAADPDQGSYALGGVRRGARAQQADLDDVAGVLGEPASPPVPLLQASVRFESDLGQDDAQTLTTDLADPLATGLLETVSGRLPTGTDEVVVNADLLAQGPAVGEDLVLAGGARLRIVGVAESASVVGAPFAAGLPGSALAPRGYGDPTYLLDVGDVSWQQVLDLNALGVLVLSRDVLADPPADDELPPEVAFATGVLDEAAITAAVLIATMVLIEVVLLAGPAFAVGARRQARTLALVAAAGGTPRDARRVVLASGVVLGVGGAVLGVVLGIGVAWLLRPVVQGFVTTRLGPFDVVATHLAAVAAFGLVSALLAAAVPAVVAARQDVVAVLAGRRGDASPSRRSPLLGAVLLAVGVALAVLGARRSSGGENLIAGSAIVCVLGMLLLVPVVVTALSRAARRLPLALRFAARDAARHRTRTVPAVAAVAATVAGVVALGIATASDEAQNAATYTPLLAVGDAAVDFAGREPDATDVAAAREALASTVPDATVTEVAGVRGSGSFEIRSSGRQPLLTTYLGVTSPLLVAERGLPGTLPGVGPLDDTRADAVDRVLADGGVVVLSDTGADVDEVRVVHRTREGREEVTVPAVVLPVEAGRATAEGVVGPDLVRELDGRVGTTALLVTGDLSDAAVEDAEQAVAGSSGSALLYVERGYQPPDEMLVLQLVLAGLGAVLMLGGTLTATFLALSDARPDLATLGAVGAASRTRRAVAAAYALVVGAVGAVLGALVGLVPGIAVSYPLTRPYEIGFGTMSGPSHVLDVPWLLLAVVVVGLPLLSAVVVGATSRSRLPLTARVE